MSLLGRQTADDANQGIIGAKTQFMSQRTGLAGRRLPNLSGVHAVVYELDPAGGGQALIPCRATLVLADAYQSVAQARGQSLKPEIEPLPRPRHSHQKRKHVGCVHHDGHAGDSTARRPRNPAFRTMRVDDVKAALPQNTEDADKGLQIPPRRDLSGHRDIINRNPALRQELDIVPKNGYPGASSRSGKPRIQRS